ncbi:origin recognition complex subunit 2 [Ceratobasidium sp. AG-I]|nr:origin recognition complex subunit 2 [Ceratobasidium sp. AG-I]
MASKTSAFDLFFHHHSRSTRSSDTLFSQSYAPLPRSTLDSLLSNTPSLQKHAKERARLADEARSLFEHWLNELFEGFNLLFYGYGSKRELVNEFASRTCAPHGHVVIVNGYLPSVGPADILSSIEQIEGILDESLIGSGADARAERIRKFFSSPGCPAPLFLVLHNIDAQQLRTNRAQRVLCSLSSANDIHIVATVDHINAPLLFPRDAALARKPHLGALSGLPTVTSWAWLWHDLTTFQPYTAELAHRDLTLPPSASTSSAATTANPALTATAGGELTESAAHHVLASVPTKAQKLFSLLLARQLASLDNEGVVRTPTAGMDKYGVRFETLLAAARDEFVAANEAALRGLLGEFRDHGMVVGREAEGEGGELLWVPAGQEVLVAISGELNK